MNTSKEAILKKHCHLIKSGSELQAEIFGAMEEYASSFKEQDTVSEEDRLVEDILSEFEKIGIDTSEWEYKFGDGNFAHEFIAAGVRDHIENLQKKEQDTDVPNGGPTQK
jgi:hypothetical protein